MTFLFGEAGVSSIVVASYALCFHQLFSFVSYRPILRFVFTSCTSLSHLLHPVFSPIGVILRFLPFWISRESWLSAWWEIVKVRGVKSAVSSLDRSRGFFIFRTIRTTWRSTPGLVGLAHWYELWSARTTSVNVQIFFSFVILYITSIMPKSSKPGSQCCFEVLSL